MLFNWKIRKENIVFVVQIFLSILTPILAYFGLTAQDVTSWTVFGGILWDAVQNPYVVGLVLVNVWSAINDPTSPGLTDSSYTLSKKFLGDTPTESCDKNG